MKIGLGLIVRNEEHDLPICLETFLPHVAAICILDTGSTDRTVEIAEQILAASGKTSVVRPYLEASDDKGRLLDFSKARNEYIRILEGWGVDYIFSADADDIYLAPQNLMDYIDQTKGDVYCSKYFTSEDRFFLTYKLWRAGLGIHFVGRVHEVLHFQWEFKIINSSIEVRHTIGHHEGQEHGTERNMRILRSEIYPPLRSLFYWANENVDIQNYPEAIKWYKEYIRRSKAGESYWEVELAHCYWRAARWLQHLGFTEEAVALSEELLEKDPSWSESWCELAHISRTKGDFEAMRNYANKALQNKYTPRLFSEPDKYLETPSNMLVFLDMIQKINSQNN